MGSRVLVRLAFAAVVVLGVTAAVGSQWDQIRTRVHEFSALGLGLAGLASVASLAAAYGSWRETLAGLGSRLPIGPGARIFFLGQLAKYLPGSVWVIVGQAEMARRLGVRRERTATAGVLTLVVSVACCLVLGLLAVPALVRADARELVWMLLAALPVGAALHPRVLTWLVTAVLRILRRPPLERPLTAAVVARVAALGALNNAIIGVQVYVLALDLGGRGGFSLLGLSIGAFCVAAAAGLAAVPLPAGAGLREVVLVLVLAPEIGTADATLVALVSRALLTAADVAVAAGVAAMTARLGAESEAEGRP